MKWNYYISDKVSLSEKPLQDYAATKRAQS